MARQRRRLQDPSNRPQYSKSPVQITLTWNSKHEVFNYNDQLNDERGDMTNIKFTVLDPSPYRITGKTEMDERIWSNLCRPFMSEKANNLVVRMKDTRGYKHTLGKGLWKDIKEEITKDYKGRWTQSLLVVLHGGYKSVWIEGQQNTDWEPVEYDRLAFINLRGNSITEGWKHSFSDSEFTAENSDFLVMIHLNSDIRYTEGRARGQKWAQPLFRINDPFDEDGETPLKKFADNVDIAETLFWDDWVPYARELWEAPEYPKPNPIVEESDTNDNEPEHYDESQYDRPKGDVRPHEEEYDEEDEEDDLPPPNKKSSKPARGSSKTAKSTKPARGSSKTAKSTKPARGSSKTAKIPDLPPPNPKPSRNVEDKMPAPVDPEDLPF